MTLEHLESGGNDSIDYIVYIAISLFVVAFFLLATYETPLWGNSVVFAIMLGVSAFVILGLKYYEGGIGEGALSAVADFDKPLTAGGLLFSIVLGAVVVGVAGIVQRGSILYVPVPQITLPFSIGPFSVNWLGDVLYQYTLVAPAEEGMKVAGIYALFLRWKNADWALVPAVAVPVFLWAAFHTIIAGFNLYLVFFAFAAGIIFYIGMRTTGSILSPIIAHGTYNGLIIVLPVLATFFGGG